MNTMNTVQRCTDLERLWIWSYPAYIAQPSQHGTGSLPGALCIALHVARGLTSNLPSQLHSLGQLTWHDRIVTSNCNMSG